jgi:hypothetical protein
VWLALGLRSWGIVTYALLFGSGLILVALVSIGQTTDVYRSRRARAARQRMEQEWAVGTDLSGFSKPL